MNSTENKKIKTNHNLTSKHINIMSTTHIGKIGRLPQNIRYFLGLKIEDGVPNKELVKWLNKDEAVQDVLKHWFGGRAITEQNLSEWKQTGHVEWVRREERRALALKLLEQRDEVSMEPEESVAEKEVSDRLGRELGMEMARLALELVEQEGNTEERWKRLCAVYQEVSQMRRDDHRAERARIQRERWKHEQELEEAAAEKATEDAVRKQALDMIQRPAMVALTAESYGHGKHGATMAELALRLKAGEDLEGTLEWFQEEQKGWIKVPGKPKCKRQKANDESRMTNGGNDDAEQEEAPSANIQGSEKQQTTEPAGSPMGLNLGGAREFETSETQQIRPNPSKSK